MKELRVILVVLGCIGFLTGCSTTGGPGDSGYQTGNTGQEPITDGAGRGRDYTGVETKGFDTGRRSSGSPLDDPLNLLSKRIIYFLFDSAEVQPEYISVVEAHAHYLASNPQVLVTLEGHADERGSREYNIALSEQRSNVIARMLVLEGVDDSQLQRIGYGEEKPVAFGHDEEDWRLNRRVEIVYSGY